MVAVPGWKPRIHSPLTTLQAAIDNEVTRATAAETDLQDQIDALVPGGGLTGVLAGLDVLDLVDQQLIKATGPATFEAIDIDAFTETLLPLTDAPAWRTALGIGAGADNAQWRTVDNLSLRAAIGQRDTLNNNALVAGVQWVNHPVKVVFVMDSHGEVSQLPSKFAVDFQARYPGIHQFYSPHILGGSNASNVAWPWTRNTAVTASVTTTNGSATITSAGLFTSVMDGQLVTGTNIPANARFTYVDANSGTLTDAATGNALNCTGSGSVTATFTGIVPGAGPAGSVTRLSASGHTVTEQASDAITGLSAYAADLVYDRLRVHFVPGTGTVDVSIDNVGVATGLGTAATTITVSTTKGSTTVTSSAAFTSAMQGRGCSAPTGIPPDTDLDTFTNTSAMVMSKPATATGSVTMTLLPTWTSPKLTQGDHTVVVTRNAGTTDVTFMQHYHGNRRQGSQVIVLSRSGYTTADFVGLSGGAVSSHVLTPSDELQDFLAREVPDCVVFCTATNDGSTGAYETNMGALLTATRATLPDATFCLWVPEPMGAGHSWMTGLAASARTLAATHDCLVADMSTVVYDHSAQSGTDSPYHVSGDGVHYLETGRTLASQLLMDVLDAPPSAEAVNSWDVTNSGGRVAIFDDGSNNGGFAVYPTGSQYGTPSVFLGIQPFLTGLFATDNAGAVDTLQYRGDPGYWHLSGWQVALGGIGDVQSFSTGAGSALVGALLTGETVTRAAVGAHGVYGGGVFGSSDGTTFDTVFHVSSADVWHTEGARIAGLGDAADQTDAMNRKMVGARVLAPVRWATFQALPACTYNNGTSGVGATLTGNANGALTTNDYDDAPSPAVGNRLLVTTQAAPAQNGIYTLTQLGDASHPFILTRAADADEAAELTAGATVSVYDGKQNNGTRWALRFAVTTVGTTYQLWRKENLGSGGVRGQQVFGLQQLGFAADGIFTYDGATTVVETAVDATITRTGAAALATNSSWLSTKAVGGIGYGTGAGGTVTQGTSKSTGVTLNKSCGAITMHNATLNANTTVSFTLTNSAIASGDVLVLNHISGGTIGSYLLNAQSASGSATVNVRNITAGNLGEAIVIEFAIVKGVTS